ncbi:hypothetical protein Bca52824_001361 [Brassica carinata]|uniref:Uncharacterized protein n=1 Tax=Brassica carinata TaxID=52824 RepID=A0A8X7WH73_BRACI|nr:hypothetical protein Bca52824_001361 [Brassica carinata]
MSNEASLKHFSVTLLRIQGGKNSHQVVTTTKPTVSSRDNICLTTHLCANSVLFTATSPTVQTPCSTKNKVSSPVGISPII